MSAARQFFTALREAPIKEITIPYREYMRKYGDVGASRVPGTYDPETKTVTARIDSDFEMTLALAPEEAYSSLSTPDDYFSRREYFYINFYDAIRDLAFLKRKPNTPDWMETAISAIYDRIVAENPDLAKVREKIEAIRNGEK